MEFDYAWLLMAFPLAFALGWLASRLDLRQLRVENRQAPLVLVVLAAFSAGLALGVLVMMPRWWKKRRASSKPPASATAPPAANDLPHGI